jgi:hypothetical protein
MYYTKLIIEDHNEITVNDAYLATIEERWKFISDGSGRSKWTKKSLDAEYTLSTDWDTVDSQQSKNLWDAGAPTVVISPNIVYYEIVRAWNTEEAAQGWVNAVAALDLPNVTITYHGNTDPVEPTV